MHRRHDDGLWTLAWNTDHLGVTRYLLTAIESDGQTRWVGDFEQGPFDTALDVAQWLTRALTRGVRPSLV